MRKLKIDDPLDAFAVHGACGLWGRASSTSQRTPRDGNGPQPFARHIGCIAVGLFCTEEYSYSPHADSTLYAKRGKVDCGIFYGGSGLLLATQIVGQHASAPAPPAARISTRPCAAHVFVLAIARTQQPAPLYGPRGRHGRRACAFTVCHAAGPIFIILWAGGLSLALFGSLKALGLLRISVEVEQKGMQLGWQP